MVVIGQVKVPKYWKSSTSLLCGDHGPRPFIPRHSGYIHALLVIRRNIDLMMSNIYFYILIVPKRPLDGFTVGLKIGPQLKDWFLGLGGVFLELGPPRFGRIVVPR